MKPSVLFSSLAILATMGFAHAGDREDVMAVIDRYIATEESGDMMGQGKLMTDDRSMVYVGGRLTGDNNKVMQEQQEYEDKHAKEFPGVHYEVEIKDVRLQLYNGNTAVVTLEWFPTRVVPASLPAEKVKALEPAKTPLIVATVLVKQAGAWKIAFSSFVPREKPNP